MSTAFLIGAGFSLTANAYSRHGDVGICGLYPLGGDLAQQCFDSSYDLSNGIEAAFQAAIEQRDHAPIGRLVEIIQGADYCCGRRAATDSGSSLRTFILNFPTAPYFTFNYDCLLEQALMQVGRWVPMDGFGVPAEVTAYPSAVSRLLETSRSSVVHLHGSLYLYPREFDISAADQSGTQWLTLKTVPEFVFDPDVNADLFTPFTRGKQDLRYSMPDERFIAPVPDKATGLAKAYVVAAYSAAAAMMRHVSQLVSIGYRFGPTDRESYHPIVRALTATQRSSLVIVDPDATAITTRLSAGYQVSITPVSRTFDQWVAEGCPGVRAA